MKSGSMLPRAVRFETCEARRLFATINGTLVHDANYNGQVDAADGVFPAFTQSVYIDLNNDLSYNGQDIKASANANGAYTFAALPAGQYVIRPILGTNQKQSLPAPGAARIVTVTTDQTATVDPIAVAQYYSLYVRVNNDLNRSGTSDAADRPVGSARVFVDYNNNGALDVGEPSNQTGSTGLALIADVKTGTYPLRTALDASWSTAIKRTQLAPAEVGSRFVGESLVTIPNRYGFITPAAFILSTIREFTFHATQRTGAINVFAFNDDNRNRIKDAAETPLAGVVAYLDLDNDGVRDTNELPGTTLGNGYYIFDTAPGNYTVRVEAPAGYTATNGLSLPVTVTAGVASDATFGLTNKQRISGLIYNDANRNGVRETTEALVTAAHTAYIDANNNGTLDAGETSMPTSHDGFWFNVLPGTYNVRLKLAAGWVQSQPANNQPLVLSGNGQTGPAFGYFGIHQTSVNTISGVVYRDNNASGVRDAAEVGVSGARVYLDINNNGAWESTELSTLTDSTGAYVLTNVAAGTYTVRQVVQNLWYQTSPAGGGGLTATVSSSTTVTGRNFGTVPPAMIYGALFDDTNANGVKDTGEAGQGPGYLVYIDANNNSQLDLNERAVPTDAAGSYYLNLLAPGTYTVRQIVPSGYRQLLPGSNAAYTITPNGQNVNANFANTKITTPPPTPTSQTLQAESATLSGGTVKATTHAGYTGTGFADYGGNGSAVQWSLNWSTAGNAKLDFRYANGSTANRPLAIVVNGVSVGSIACAPTGSWTTWKTVSLTVSLKAGTNTIKATAGAATGANVDSLIVTPTSTTPTPPPTPTTGSISGYTFNDSDKDGILDTNESKASGKTVFLDTNNNGKLDSGEKSLVTDSSGSFNFTGLSAGTYFVRRVFPAGYTYSTPLRNITLTAGQVFSNVTIGSKTV